ncbi:MAG: hypothetical protein ACI9PZ_003254 [Parvicella sp.]|jgi:hypothetical protein
MENSLRTSRKLSGSIGAYFNKISGSLFIGAAVVLGLKVFD